MGKKLKRKPLSSPVLVKTVQEVGLAVAYGTALEKTSEEGMKDRSVTDVGYIDLKIACLSLCTE